MHFESVKLALYDIRDNILLAGEFVEGLTCEGFSESRLHLYAVTRALEIIPEASRRLPDDLRDRHPLLAWRSIRDVGNFYRHRSLGYSKAALVGGLFHFAGRREAAPAAGG